VTPQAEYSPNVGAKVGALLAGGCSVIILCTPWT